MDKKYALAHKEKKNVFYDFAVDEGLWELRNSCCYWAPRDHVVELIENVTGHEYEIVEVNLFYFGNEVHYTVDRGINKGQTHVSFDFLEYR